MPRQVELLGVTANPPSTNRQWFIVGEDEVTGTVIVETNKPLECNYISVTLEGVGWMRLGTELVGCGDAGTAREEYIKETTDLWRKEAAHGQVSLPPGRHELPFRFSLPAYLPPTLNLIPLGVIEYTLIARIAKSGIFSRLRPDKTARRVIDVKRKGTHLPGDNTASRGQFQTDIGCGSCNCCGGLCACCCDCCKTGCFTCCSRTCCYCSSSGPVSLTAEIPRTYFSVGETIPIKATVENEGNKAIRVKAKLVQEMQFTGRTHTKTYKKQLKKVESNRMQPHTTTIWEPVIIVPTRIDTTLPRNVGKIVSIIYYLVVEVSEPWGATACFISEVTVAPDSQRLSAPPPQVDAPVQMPGPQQLPRPLQVGAPYQAPDPQQAPLLGAYPLWSEATAPPQPVSVPYQPIQPAAAEPQLTAPVLQQPVGPSAPQLEPGFADLPPSYAEAVKTEQ